MLALFCMRRNTSCSLNLNGTISCSYEMPKPILVDLCYPLVGSPLGRSNDPGPLGRWLAVVVLPLIR